MSSCTCRGALVFASTSVARTSSKQLGERCAVDLQGDLAAGGCRQIEARSMKALVEKAQTVAVEPQDLQARSASPTEHEDRAAVDRISPDALARELRQAIEAESHVDRLDTKEHADA
jgi:hypothetical protein